MKSLAALLLLLITLPARAADFAAVDREIERLMQAGGVPGAAVVIVRDGQVIHTRAFGVTSVETNVPVTPKTLFRLGSTSKLFTALAALKLAENGALRLDQPAGELVPDLPPKLQRLTLEQLLTHTAGLAEESSMHGPLEESALHERVTRWTDAVFFTEPGEIFSYANNGYVLAGDVIAHVAKKPFAEAIRTLVLEPLQMRDSTYRPLEAFTHPVALGHEQGAVIRPFPEHAGNYPPGSLFSSAEDLGRALAAMPLAKLSTPRATIAGQHRGYGYGVIVDDNRGPRLVLHTGARAGYGSIVMFLPEQKVAVAILANRTGAVFSSAAFAALEPFAPLRERQKPAGDLPLTREELASIAGVYSNGSLKVELAAEGERLVLRMGERVMPVQRTGTWTFRVEGGRQLEELVLVPDASGAPRYLAADVAALRKRS